MIKNNKISNKNLKLKKGSKKQPSQKKPSKMGSQYDSAPVSLQRAERITRPIISSSMKGGDGRIRIRHREYIADVTGSVAFSNTQYPVQPGLILSFPWLSRIAPNYESYQFNSLQYEFETLAPTSQAGRVMINIDYDASDPAPIDKTDFMSYNDSVSSAAWQQCCFKASLQDLKKFGVQRYVRNGTVLSTDIKTYDIGNLNIATQGATANAVGELYVSYDIEFMTPQRNLAPLSLSIGGATSITKNLPLGSAPIITGTLPVIISSVGNTNVLTFQSVGQYLIEIIQLGTGLITPVVTASTATNVTAVVSQYNAALTSGVASWITNFLNPNQTFVLDCSGDTSVTATSVRIASYAYSDN